MIRTWVLLFTCLVSSCAFAQTTAQPELPPAHWSFGGFQSIEVGYFSGSAALVKHFGDLSQFPHFSGPVFSTKAEVTITRRFGVGLGFSLAQLSGTGPVADQHTDAELAAAGLHEPRIDGTFRMRLKQINPHLTVALVSRKKLRVGVTAGPSIAWLDHVYKGRLAATVETDSGTTPVVQPVFDKGRDFLPLAPQLGFEMDLNIIGPLHWHASGSFNTFGVQTLTGIAFKF